MEISKEEFIKACNNKLEQDERLAREKAQQEQFAREKAERERLARIWADTLKNLPTECKRGFTHNGYIYSIDYDNKGFSKRKASF